MEACRDPLPVVPADVVAFVDGQGQERLEDRIERREPVLVDAETSHPLKRRDVKVSSPSFVWHHRVVMSCHRVWFHSVTSLRVGNCFSPPRQSASTSFWLTLTSSSGVGAPRHRRCLGRDGRPDLTVVVGQARVPAVDPQLYVQVARQTLCPRLAHRPAQSAWPKNIFVVELARPPQLRRRRPRLPNVVP